VLLVALAGLPAATALAQNPPATEAKIREQRAELERIRREREELQERMRSLQGREHDLSEEVQNLHRQADATARVVRTLDGQLESLIAEVDGTTAGLVRAEDELAIKRSVLRQRLVDIYKRGPLYTTEALLSARSFGDLVGRYKYLHELAVRDRALLSRVEALYQQVSSQREQLVRLQSEFERSRQEKVDEQQRLRTLQRQRSRSLAQTKNSRQEIQNRLARIQRDEKQLADVIAAFEAARKRAESAAGAGAASTSSIRTSDFGNLDWPVNGEILYRFGRAVNPNNTTIRWNGVGIAAQSGTAVRSVSAGEVMVVQSLGTYGLTIIIQHGGGDYSVYGSLAMANVEKGQQVLKGQVIGQVGVSDPELPAHLHFEIRPKGRAMDPLAWLRAQR
jgi:septal ring factor EnvC (AmiA/AmiB activator)